MRKELLNHRPTSALREQSLLCESVGTGHTSTHPSIFTKVLLVLLTTLLLPSTAWADYSYGGQALVSCISGLIGICLQLLAPIFAKGAKAKGLNITWSGYSVRR